MQILKPILWITIAFACSALWAQEPAIFRPEKRATKVEVVDSTKSDDIKLNVDIFGDIPVGSYYILWTDVDVSDEMKKLMTTRDFARDEFFMQNIDREEFEQEIKIPTLTEGNMLDFVTGVLPEGKFKNEVGGSNQLTDAMIMLPVFSALLGKKKKSLQKNLLIKPVKNGYLEKQHATRIS